MIHKLLVFVTISVYTLMLAAVAQAQVVTIVQQPSNVQKWTTRSESDLLDQSTHIAVEWGTPTVTFNNITCNTQCGGTYTIYMGTVNWLTSLGFNVTANGSHFSNITAYSTLGPHDTPGNEAVLDHEFAEMLVDPTITTRSPCGTLEEIVDPVQGNSYKGPNGSYLSDWVFPSFYTSNGGTNPYDWMGVATAPDAC